ncbi:hypothetical protein [Mesorhizobium qingshengii]|uniref:Uncharacterized protein n=1 Tax=Mesorhizobium qingshengii TaxID=1165689 RepID=A0A1G5V2Y4_9HYPH|nr:hypothetical protein [Mesorhizobium qingshengii]SDA40230.1 hypothetical protein SAMN02927914_00217 [Mesorhizobium qingshengii]
MKSKLSELTRAERYALGQIGRVKRNRSSWKASPALMRLREIEKVIKARHGSVLPETDDADLYIRAAAFSCTGQDMRQWCARWAPWASPDLIKLIATAAAKRRHMMSANGVAGMLMVSMEERTRLGLNTIGACDMSLQDRQELTKQRKRERDRSLVEQKRRAAGKVDRASYLAAHAVSRDKPWEVEGISRRTWYRRGTGQSRVEVLHTGGDTLVPTIPPVPVISKQSSGKAGRRGSGDHPPAGYQGAAPHGSGDKINEEAA